MDAISSVTALKQAATTRNAGLAQMNERLQQMRLEKEAVRDEKLKAAPPEGIGARVDRSA